MNDIGKNIKFYRNKAGLTQEKLATRANVSTNYIALIEGGKRNPRPSTIDDIAKSLNIDARDLCGQDPLVRELSELAGKYDINRIMSQLEKMINQAQCT